MEAGLVVMKTTNKDKVLSVLLHEDIRDVIADDNGVVDFDIEDHTFLIGETEKRPVAVMIYTKKDGWFCHFQVLPEARKNYADEFAKRSLKWFWKSISADNIQADIPEIYPNVIKFAEKQGFKHKKTLEKSYVKNSTVYNEFRYILERPSGIL